MILSLLRLQTRYAAWAALMGACGTAMACSNSPPSPADAFVQAYLNSGPNGTQCPLQGASTNILGIGSPTPSKPSTVQDGGNNGGGNVSVSCKVTQNGNNFDIDLSAEQQGTAGGSITITGSVDPMSGAMMNIQGQFASQTDGNYASNNCSVTYVYLSGAVPVTPYVAGGRIWGHISCPSAVNNQQSQAGKPATCDGEADFLFEQCSQ